MNGPPNIQTFLIQGRNITKYICIFKWNHAAISGVGWLQGKKIKVSGNAENGYKCILVRCRKHDPARPTPLTIYFLHSFFESFPSFPYLVVLPPCIFFTVSNRGFNLTLQRSCGDLRIFCKFFRWQSKNEFSQIFIKVSTMGYNNC